MDFVLSFEELQGMFEAKEIDLAEMEDDPDIRNAATAAGRGFAVAGGVAQAVVDIIHEQHPDMEIKVANAEGLRDCRKLMTMAKAGKYNGFLLEGMACPGGCIAGAGTMLSVEQAAKAVEFAKKASTKKNPLESEFSGLAEELT